MKRFLWLSLTAVLSCCFFASTQADEPRNLPPQKDTLQAVLDRIKQHAAGDAWKQPGFKDDAIEAWLDKLLGSIAIATDINDLKLPVRLADVKDSPPTATGSLRRNLTVCKDFNPQGLTVMESVILADGNATIGHVENSVVIARGTITIESSSANCVLVAGISYRGGERDGGGRSGLGSVVVTRGWAELASSADGTIVAANAGVSHLENLGLSRLNNVIFINAPVPQQGGLRGQGFGGIARDNGNKSVRVSNLPLEELPVHPLAAKFKVLGVLHTIVKAQPGALVLRSMTGLKPTAVIVQHEGRRYIADLDQPVVDESGQPLPALAGYRLITIATPYVMFSKPDADLVLRVEGK